MIQPKEIIKVGLILFVITALSALILAVANSVTSPIIAENNKIKTEKMMQALLTDADSFEIVDVEAQQVVEAYIAKSGDDVVGTCVVSEANGYGGAVKVITGIDKEGKVTGVDILEHSETPGLGANATKPEFKSQFEGMTMNIGVSRGSASGNEINAMSGATVTSKAVTEAVNAALAISQILLGSLQ